MAVHLRRIAVIKRENLLPEFEDPDEAAERLNTVLHMVYDRAEEDIETERLEKILAHTWSIWHQDDNLLYVNDDDLLDWVDHLLATWDDADNLD